MPDDPQIYYTFSRTTPTELGPRRTFITRTGRAGSVSPYCHGANVIDARTFASKTEARTWFECRRPEVQRAMMQDGFALTEIRAEVVFDQWPSDDELDMLAAVGALEDTVAGALDDASDQLAAEHLGMPVETFRAVLARASADAEEESASTAEADQAARFTAFSEMVRDFRRSEPAGDPMGEWPAGVKTPVKAHQSPRKVVTL